MNPTGNNAFFHPQVWALATAGFVPKYPDVFDTTLISSSDRTNLDDVPHDSVTECFYAATSELTRRPWEFKEQEIKDILWSLSRAGVRHPLLFRAVAEHLVGGDFDDDGNGRGLRGFSPQGIGNLAWSYAKQAQIAFSSSDGTKGLNIGSSGRQAVYETSCLDVGEVLINRLFSGIADSALNDNGMFYNKMRFASACPCAFDSF